MSTQRPVGDATRDRIYAAIRSFTLREGMPPTVRELMAEAGITSTGHMDYHLRILAQQRRISWRPGKSRTLRVTGGVA